MLKVVCQLIVVCQLNVVSVNRSLHGEKSLPVNLRMHVESSLPVDRSFAC